jgi:hypothetical protein
MTPEDRRKLIETPITFYVAPSKGWGGHVVHASVPTDGQQRPVLRASEDGLVYGHDYRAYIPEGL